MIFSCLFISVASQGRFKRYLIVGEQPLVDNLPLCGLAFFINQCGIVVWAVGGHGLRRLLHRKRLMSVVHVVIVLATVYCAVSLWLD